MTIASRFGLCFPDTLVFLKSAHAVIAEVTPFHGPSRFSSARTVRLPGTHRITHFSGVMLLNPPLRPGLGDNP